jgi:hypothetical protein
VVSRTELLAGPGGVVRDRRTGGMSLRTRRTAMALALVAATVLTGCAVLSSPPTFDRARSCRTFGGFYSSDGTCRNPGA